MAVVSWDSTASGISVRLVHPSEARTPFLHVKAGASESERRKERLQPLWNRLVHLYGPAIFKDGDEAKWNSQVAIIENPDSG
jgi:hypothetical protein